MKRVGLIARCTDSGLGHLSKSFYDNYPVFSTLCVTDADQRYKDHIDWFPDATFVRMADMRNFPFARFLSNIDVLFGYETFYERQLLEQAHRLQVRTVLMGMPELTRRRGNQGFLGDANQYVWPTRWLKPKDEPLLPVPVQTVEDISAPLEDGPLRVVHVAGSGAIGDRNGTEIFLRSLKLVKSQVYVRLCVSASFPTPLVSVPDNVTLEVRRDVSDPFYMYADAHVMIMPRRYGGLCLPVHEALGYGLVVYLTDYVYKTGDYPTTLMLDSEPGLLQRVPVGRIRTHVVDPSTVAEAIDQIAERRELLVGVKDQNRAWVHEHSWPQLKPAYDGVFAG